MLSKITVPTLLLDKKKATDNIYFMLGKARKHGLIFRPHFKTHQSLIIGRWFRDAGVDKITVSSFKMAQYFASDGWKDITVAFPVNIREIELINELAKEINLNIVIESKEALEFLSNNLKYNVGVFIKIDAGYNRTGIECADIEYINALIRLIRSCRNMKFNGFLTYTGQSYRLKTPSQIPLSLKKTLNKLSLLKKAFINDYPDIIISIGDTPSCTLSDDFTGADEIRPGNFIFYDVMMISLSVCTWDKISVCLACPVVAKHTARKEIVFYGGSVHFSKENLIISGKEFYGLVTRITENGWSEPVKGVYAKALYQEHGILKCDNTECFNSINVGDLIGVLPVHSCLTADCMKSYLTLDGEVIGHL